MSLPFLPAWRSRWHSVFIWTLYVSFYDSHSAMHWACQPNSQETVYSFVFFSVLILSYFLIHIPTTMLELRTHRMAWIVNKSQETQCIRFKYFSSHHLLYLSEGISNMRNRNRNDPFNDFSQPRDNTVYGSVVWKSTYLVCIKKSVHGHNFRLTSSL